MGASGVLGHCTYSKHMMGIEAAELTVYSRGG